MPHSRPSRQRKEATASGGYLPLTIRVSTVRFPIPQWTFKCIVTVQTVTDETCHIRTFTADEVIKAKRRVSYA
jgi:hypothetical protein